LRRSKQQIDFADLPAQISRGDLVQPPGDYVGVGKVFPVCACCSRPFVDGCNYPGSRTASAGTAAAATREKIQHPNSHGLPYTWSRGALPGPVRRCPPSAAIALLTRSTDW